MEPVPAPAAWLLALPQEVLRHGVWPKLGPASRAALRSTCQELRALADAKLPTSLSFEISGGGGKSELGAECLSLLRRAQGSVSEVCLCFSKCPALTADDLARVVGAVAEAAQHKLTHLSLHFAHTSFTWGPEVVRTVASLSHLQQLRLSAGSWDTRAPDTGTLLLSGTVEGWEQAYALLPPSLHTLCYDVPIAGAEQLFQGPHVAGLGQLRSLRRLYLGTQKSAGAQPLDLRPVAQALLAMHGQAVQAEKLPEAPEAAAAAAAEAAVEAEGSSSPQKEARSQSLQQQPADGGLQALGLAMPEGATSPEELLAALANIARLGRLTHLGWNGRKSLPCSGILPHVASTVQHLELHQPQGDDSHYPLGAKTICGMQQLQQLTLSGRDWSEDLAAYLVEGHGDEDPQDLPRLACLRIRQAWHRMNYGEVSDLEEILHKWPNTHVVFQGTAYDYCCGMDKGQRVQIDILRALAKHPGGWSYETEPSPSPLPSASAVGLGARSLPLVCERMVEINTKLPSSSGDGDGGSGGDGSTCEVDDDSDRDMSDEEIDREYLRSKHSADEAAGTLAIVIPYLEGLVLGGRLPGRLWAADALGLGSSLRVLGLKGVSSGWFDRLFRLSELRAAGHLPALRELWLMEGPADDSSFTQEICAGSWGPMLANLLNQGRKRPGAESEGASAAAAAAQGRGPSTSAVVASNMASQQEQRHPEAGGAGAVRSTPLIARLVPQREDGYGSARAMLAFIRPMLFDKDSLLLGAGGPEEEGVEVRRQRAVAASVQAAQDWEACPALAEAAKAAADAQAEAEASLREAVFRQFQGCGATAAALASTARALLEPP